MTKINATTNKVIINYTDGQTYTLSRVYKFIVCHDGKSIIVSRNNRKADVKQDITETILLKNVEYVLYRKSGTQGTIEYVVEQGVIKQTVEVKDFIEVDNVAVAIVANVHAHAHPNTPAHANHFTFTGR